MQSFFPALLRKHASFRLPTGEGNNEKKRVYKLWKASWQCVLINMKITYATLMNLKSHSFKKIVKTTDSANWKIMGEFCWPGNSLQFSSFFCLTFTVYFTIHNIIMFTGKAPFSTERSHYWQYEYHSEIQSDTWEYPLNLLTVPKENPLISKNKNICYVSQYILTHRSIWVHEPVWKRPRYSFMLPGLLFLIGHQITVLEILWINNGLLV